MYRNILDSFFIIFKCQIIEASAKSGIGVDKIFDAIINKIPPPSDKDNDKTRALIFDSTYDNYKGAIPYIRVFDGILKKGMPIKFHANGEVYEITEVGHFVLKMVESKELKSGDVGYVLASIRDMAHIQPGDTVTSNQDPCLEPLPGYKKIKPMVFSGLYPVEGDEYDQLRVALEKLKLNDASLEFLPETSEALGFGFRCGFLGLLHMEIIQERLEREFNLNLITTTPNVIYEVLLRDGSILKINTPSQMPSTGDIDKILEPMVSAEILAPKEFIGSIMTLCQKKISFRKSAKRRSKKRSTEKVRRKMLKSKIYSN